MQIESINQLKDVFDGYRQRTEVGKVSPYRKIFTTATVQINAPQTAGQAQRSGGKRRRKKLMAERQ